MFEEKTFENILNDMLSNVNGKFDKREGSIIYDALAPAAIELSQLYADLDEILNQVFADTQAREYLIRRAAERGLEPYKAGFAVVKGEFDVMVGAGERFSLGTLNFETLEYLGEEKGYYFYSMKCETRGSAGNITGSLIPIDNISGLGHAAAVEILIYGEDEEETEAFRKRYFDSINNIAFGGNVADYKNKVKAFDGVGGVKVYRADKWKGAGTVKLVITSSQNTVPSEELIHSLKEAIDPVDYEGDGVGLAPIGHIVTVEGASSVNVDVRCRVTSDGSNSDINDDLRLAFENHIKTLNEKWEDYENITVYISHIISCFLKVKGVKDVKEVYINSQNENLSIADDCIAMAGSLDVEVSLN